MIYVHLYGTKAFGLASNNYKTKTKECMTQAQIPGRAVDLSVGSRNGLLLYLDKNLLVHMVSRWCG